MEALKSHEDEKKQANKCIADELFEEINSAPSRDEELKHIQELEQKLNMQENYEIKIMMIQKNLQKLQISETRPEDKQEINNDVEKTTKTEIPLKEKNEFQNKSYNKHKNIENNSLNNFIRPRTYNNGFNKPRYENPHNKQSYFERGRRGQRNSRVCTRYYNYRGRYKQNYRERFPSRRDIENINYQPVPATVEEEEEMLRQGIQLSKQHLFIEKLQKKQLEKALQNDIESSKSPPDVSEKRTKQHETHPSNFNNRENFNLTENKKPQKHFIRETSRDEYKNKYSENGSSSRGYRSHNSYPSNNRYNNNYNSNYSNATQNDERNKRKRFEDNSISNRLFINSIRSIKESNESRTFNSPLKAASSEKAKSTHKDDWNRIASNDLKTMLHIGNNGDKTNIKKEAKYVNEIECNTTSNSNNFSGKEYQNMRSEKEARYNDWNRYNDQRNSTYHFNKYHNNLPYVRGGMRKTRGNQQHYGTRGSRTYQPTYSNSRELEWKPYSKQVEEGRFDNVPPRFKKMMNNKDDMKK